MKNIIFVLLTFASLAPITASGESPDSSRIISDARAVVEKIAARSGREAPAWEEGPRVIAALTSLLPDSDAAATLIVASALTAPRLGRNWRESVEYECATSKSCSDCFAEKFYVDLKVDGGGRADGFFIPWSWVGATGTQMVAAARTHHEMLLLMGPLPQSNGTCILHPSLYMKLPLAGSLAKALLLVGKRQKGEAKPTTTGQLTRALAGRWVKDGLYTVVTGSNHIEQEACIPFQFQVNANEGDSGTVSTFQPWGPHEYSVDFVEPDGTAIDEPLPAWLNDRGAARLGLCEKGLATCENPRWLRRGSGLEWSISGDPSREFSVYSGSWQGPGYTMPTDCKIPGLPRQPAGTEVYVHDVRAMLHVEPLIEAWGSVASIGAQCKTTGQQKKNKVGDWVEVECGKDKGYVLGWEVNLAPPDVEAFAKKAADVKLPPAQRLNYALRVLALGKKEEVNLRAFAETYYAIRSKEYAQLRGGEEERTLDCATLAKLAGLEGFADAKECLGAAFRRAPYLWDVLRFENGRFIRTVQRERWMEEDAGTFAGDGKEVRVKVQRRRWYGEPGVLAEALVLQGRAPAEGTKFDSKPMLDPESLQRLGRLPSSKWLEVNQERTATPVVHDFMCELRPLAIEYDLNGVARVEAPALQMSEYFTILSYSGARKSLSVCRQQGGCQEKREVQFYWAPDSQPPMKTAFIGDFYHDEGGHTYEPEATAKLRPLESGSHCINGKYFEQPPEQRERLPGEGPSRPEIRP